MLIYLSIRTNYKNSIVRVSASQSRLLTLLFLIPTIISTIPLTISQSVDNNNNNNNIASAQKQNNILHESLLANSSSINMMSSKTTITTHPTYQQYQHQYPCLCREDM